jgi:signal transduction histidine kinase
MSGSSSVKSLSQERSLDALLRIGVASAHVLDPNLHIRLVLDELIKIMGAERGFVLLVNPKTDELELMSGRDRDGNDLSGVSKYSTTVVANVKDTRTAQIVCGSDEGEALGSESIVAQDLRSIMAVPLEIGERLIGVIYADSRIVKGLFTPDDLNLFKAIANHIASTLEMARAATVELEKQALEKDMALVAEKLNVAHAAGMAEVAIETIHNIGNILNTVGLRMARMADTLNDSELPAPVREKILKDVTPLERGLENIRTVVAAQQKYATVGLHKEATQIAPFLDEVLEMHMLRIHQQEIRVHKKYEEVPAVLLQKHKLLNVVSNLVENAIEAMSETQVGQKDLTIEIRPVDKFIEIRISDSGMGISPQELGSIFRQGYTTKKDGHGFGLHSCANAMSELGGSLEAESAGRAQGATFVLKIPTFT